MNICDKCSKRVYHMEGEDPVDRAHMFVGYGFMVRYHPICCPREVDGLVCEEDHPEGMDSSLVLKTGWPDTDPGLTDLENFLAHDGSKSLAKDLQTWIDQKDRTPTDK